MSASVNGYEAVNREETRNRNLLKLIEKSGCPITQVNGQRIFGPPRLWPAPPPKKGSEIFVGKIPPYIMEDELHPLFQQAGPIYTIRLMIDFSGKNRGYAFITFVAPEFARAAVARFNNYEIRRNHYIGVYKSLDNCRLFVRSIPVDKSKSEVWENLALYLEGIVDVIMYPANNVEHQYNRGYVFVEFDCHRSAALARRLLGSGVQLWDTLIAGDWADPLPEVDPVVMKRVTNLYIRNLGIDVTTSELQAYIAEYVPLNIIDGMHKTSDYAFLNFCCREDAEKALDLLEGVVIEGKQIEVSWARPRMYSKEFRMITPANNFCTSVPPRMRKSIYLQRAPRPQNMNAAYSISQCICGSPTQMNGSENVCFNINQPNMNIFNLRMHAETKSNMF